VPNIFEGYKIVVLDSTFFSARFTKEFKASLNNVKIYVSGTFNTEIEEYRLVLSTERKKIYSENFDYISKNLILNTMNFDSAEGKGDKLNNDIWGLIDLIADINKKINAKIAVITANKLLMQKIVLYGVDVDCYDLNKQVLVFKRDYSSMKNAISFHETTSTSNCGEVRVTTGTTVYLSGNRSVVLDEEVNSGLEATLYAVKNDKSRIVKVFKKDKLGGAKLKNIQNVAGINDELKIEWAIFPTEVVYSDCARKIPIGFIENRIDTGNNLGENSLYFGAPLEVEEEYLNKRISYSLDICRKIVRQVCYLNSYGFFISDFNMGNFAISNMSYDVIQMWDTDSFGYQGFFGRYFSQEYKECVNHLPYDISKKEGAIAISEDALHQFVFKVLALGDSPISEYTNTFKYDKSDYIGLIRRSFFPINVWNYLADVFRGNKQPSSEMLLYELSVATKWLEKCPGEDKTVRQLFVDAFPGYLDALSNSKNESETIQEPEVNRTISVCKTIQQPVKKQKHPIKKIFKLILWIILVYCIYAWIMWDQLPWETDVWEAIFNNGSQTEAGIEESEWLQPDLSNAGYEFTYLDEVMYETVGSDLIIVDKQNFYYNVQTKENVL